MTGHRYRGRTRCGARFLLLMGLLAGRVLAGAAPGVPSGVSSAAHEWLDVRDGPHASSNGLLTQTRPGARPEVIVSDSGNDESSEPGGSGDGQPTDGIDGAETDGAVPTVQEDDASVDADGSGTVPGALTGDDSLPQRIDINSADAIELAAALPGIGPSKAQAIIEWREAHGPFRTLEQLLEVSGIGPATLENIRPLIHLGSGRRLGALPRLPAAGERELIGSLATALARVEQDRRKALASIAESE